MFCGFPLSKSYNEDKEKPQCSTLDKEESGFGWKVIVVRYARGMSFGIMLGCNVFFVGKLQWLARLVCVKCETYKNKHSKSCKWLEKKLMHF